MSGKFVAAEKNKPEDAPIGLIPIDAIYSPVKKVSYDVQPTREGQVLDYDKLTMNIETDGYKAKVASTKNHSYDNKNLDINYSYSYDEKVKLVNSFGMCH